MDGLPQKIGLRDEIGIENTNKLTLGGRQAGFQSARFKARAIDPMNQLDIKAPAFNSPRRQR